MRLASYLVDGQPRAGVVASDQTLVAVSDLVAGGPSYMLAVLAAGPSLWDRLRATATSARGGQALSSARLVAPVDAPLGTIQLTKARSAGAVWRPAEGALEVIRR